MKKTYVEPEISMFNIDVEPTMLASSPDLSETPGSNGLGEEPLGPDDTGYSKRNNFGWFE